MALRRRESNALGGAIWPGFVDAMTAMLLVLTFVLSIFMITQYFLRETITGQEDTITEQEQTIEQKERALDTLSSRLDLLSDILSLERTEKEKLAEDGSRLRASLADVSDAKATADDRIVSLIGSLATSEEGRAELDEQLIDERAALAQQQAETEALEALTASLREKAAADLEAAQGELFETLAALTDAETKRLVEQEAAKALRERLASSETEMTALELELDKRRAEAEETLTLLAAANAAREELRTDLGERDADLTRQQALLKVARSQLATVEASTEEEQQQVALLNEQTRELRAQLRSLEKRLATTEAARDTAESDAEGKTEEIASLGTRLNAALAEKNTALEQRQAALLKNRELLEAQVDELEDFRSEFFGQVRRVLGGRDEIKIVGDRFVFQSEVLFAPASADLAVEGKAELGKFADILNEIAAEIPTDVNWILRIDGHTDKRPLRNSPRYRNNWELSQARALSVAEYLIREHDVPSERLAPTGFGEFQPLDKGDSPEALGRNRRIELKLTER